MIDRRNGSEHLFLLLAEVIRENIPGFEIKYKNESKMQRFLSKLLFFNKEYMTEFTSVFRYKVFLPSREYVKKNPSKAFKVLAHEFVHLLDKKKRPLLFGLLYSFPQNLFVLALSALSAIWIGWPGLFGLVFLLALLPWKSRPRALLELRGYAMNLAVNAWKHGSVKPDTLGWIADTFCDWSYYKMYPKKEAVVLWLEEYLLLIQNIDSIHDDRTIFDESEAFQAVYELMTGIEYD